MYILWLISQLNINFYNTFNFNTKIFHIFSFNINYASFIVFNIILFLINYAFDIAR